MAQRRLAIGVLVLLGFPLAAAADEWDDLLRECLRKGKDAEDVLAKVESCAAGIRSAGDRAAFWQKVYANCQENAKGYLSAVLAARAMQGLERGSEGLWQQRVLDMLKRDWQSALGARKAITLIAYIEELLGRAEGLLEAGRSTQAEEHYKEAKQAALALSADGRRQMRWRLERLDQRLQAHRSIERCRLLLQKSPQNIAIRTWLLRLYVVEIDKPGKAREFLTPDVPEDWRTYVPLAAGDPNQLDAAVCLGLADWYKHQAEADGVTKLGKQNALQTARTYYMRCAEAGPKAGPRGFQAKQRLVDVEKELHRLLVGDKLSAGLIAYYPFNGDARDCSGNGHDGVVRGPTLTTDRFGRGRSAYRFDGENDCIEIGGKDAFAIDQRHEGTLSCWIKSTSLRGEHIRIFSTGSAGWSPGYWVGYPGGRGDIRVEISDGVGSGVGFQGKRPVRGDNSWHHVVVVLSGSKAFIYLDAKRELGITHTERQMQPSGEPHIGCSYNHEGGSWFDGVIDDLRVYNRALSADEIQLLFNEPGA